MGRRTWVKIYCEKWLRGSIRKESAALRGIFADLITMAGDSAYGDIGEICLADEVGMTDEQMAGILNLTVEEWMAARRTLENHPEGKKENRIQIVPLRAGFKIKIINFEYYQGEYERQKKYRVSTQEFKKLFPGLQPGVTAQSNTPKYQREGEGEREREGDKNKKESPSVYVGKRGTGREDPAHKKEPGPHLAPGNPELPKSLRIQLNYEIKRWEGITQEDKDFWKQTFPAVNIDDALTEALGYWEARPQNRRIYWKQTIFNRLKFLQDHSKPGQTTNRESWAARKAAEIKERKK